jgi:serpin B
MRVHLRGLAVLLVALLVMSACADQQPSPSPSTSPPAVSPAEPGGAELARADVARATSTDVTAAQLAMLVAGDTDFAMDLFRVAAGDGNALLSPYSVAAALTMTYAGARGDTAQEMRSVLHLALPDDRIHAARNELDLRITAEPAVPEGADGEPFAIRVANSLWGQAGYPFLEEFLAVLAENYDAGMNLVDYVAAAEQARQTINAWVEEQTEGRIVDLIPEGVITDLTRLVLVNAIWFKASWATPFDPGLTRDGAFRLLDGGDVTVPLMHGNLRLPYLDGDGFQAVRLPYAGDASMLIILPDPGRFEQMVDRLSASDLDAIRRAESEHLVELSMPTFEYRSQLQLKPALQELGMVAAFTDPALPDGADFTGIIEARQLLIHDVVHQAFIAVDEEGTEAAAATAVVIGDQSAPMPVTVSIGRPFLFLIEHRATGELLFIGQVTDPS